MYAWPRTESVLNWPMIHVYCIIIIIITVASDVDISCLAGCKLLKVTALMDAQS